MGGRTGAPFRDGRTRCRGAPSGLQCDGDVRSRGRCANEIHTADLPLAYPVGVIPLVPGRLVALALVAALAAACGTSAPSFDPAGPCTADGRAPGAYPDLEHRLPATFEGRAPDSVDSGRTCTSAALGPLTGHGVTELRFAGAIWKLSERGGATLAVFSAPGLDADALADFYEAGAQAGRATENVERRTESIAGATVDRIETLNDQTSFQTVAVLHGTAPDVVEVALVASDVHESPSRAAHDALVVQAVEALAGN